VIDFVGLGILSVLVLLFGYLTIRAWGSRRGWLKWVGLVLGGLATILFAALFIGAILGTTRLNADFNARNPAPQLTVAANQEQLEWGAKYAQFCAGCHSPDNTLPLVGNDFGGEIPIPIGTLYAPNLTPAGDLKDWTDGEILRAIREGVHKNGRPLLVMPAGEFHALSDEDAMSLIAYLRSQPAAGADTPENQLNAIGALLANMPGILQNQPHISQPVPKPAVEPNAEYGKYLAEILVCSSCHGEKLTGGISFDGSAAPNLTLVVPQWSEEQFFTAFRTGTLPGGKTLDPNKMPSKEFSAFATDTDLKALYQYLHGLTPTQAASQ